MQEESKSFKLKMRVQETGHTFLPTEVRKAGFEGEIDILPNHFTAVLVKPGATSAQIVRSLQAHIKHMQMVIEEEQAQLKESQQSKEVEEST